MKFTFCNENKHYLKEDFHLLQRLHQRKEEKTLWKKESTFCTFAFVAEEAVQNVQIVIQSTHEHLTCRLKKVHFVPGNMGRGSVYGKILNEPAIDLPDMLLPYGGAQDFEKDTFQVYWLEITTSLLSTKGNYPVEIQLFLNGRLTQTLELTVKVSGFALSQEMNELFPLELWAYPYSVSRMYQVSYMGEDCERLVKENLLAYQKAGGEVIAATIVHDPWNHQTYDEVPSLIKWHKKNGHFSFDFKDFDTYISWNLDVGIQKKIKCFSLLPWENRLFYYDENGQFICEKISVQNPLFKEYWGQFLAAFIAHLEEKGWFEKTYIAIDERPVEELEAVIELLQHHVNTKGEALKISCAINYSQEMDTVFLENFSDVCVSQAHIKDAETFRDFAQRRRALGLCTYFYNCVGDYPSMFAYSEPIEAKYLMWYGAGIGADGFLRWALDAWVENPLCSMNHWYWEAGDPFLIYPHEKGFKEPYVTVRFEMMKKALNDVRKFLFLKKKNKELSHIPLPQTLPSGTTNLYGARVSENAQNFDEMQELVLQLEKTIEKMSHFDEKNAIPSRENLIQ